MQTELAIHRLWSVAHATARRWGPQARRWRRSQRDLRVLRIEATPRLPAAQAIHVVFERLLPVPR
jgi:hypothetical protein